MGNYIPSSSPSTVGRKGVKRRRTDEDDEEERERKEEKAMNTPKKMKLTSTSNYIYETLYLKGESSDVTVVALDRDWKLHRVYLRQSGYFSSLFQGSWKDSSAEVIHMTIPDENIDEEALDIALGSLYKGDVLIKPTSVINILAAATWLSLDGLITQCVNVMLETISCKTVCTYYTAASMYGQRPITDACIDWLEKNLMRIQSVSLLKELGVELMTKVISSAGLFVVHVEMDVYSMLKKWLFLQLEEHWEGKKEDLPKAVDQFFKAAAEMSHCDFLESMSGTAYIPAFRALRLQHIFNDYASSVIIEEDCIIPMRSWLFPRYRQLWLQMLRVEAGQDTGPKTAPEVDFDKYCMRVGRVLEEEKQHCWRWTGYNFGLDLVVSFGNRLVLFKRNITTQFCSSAVSLQEKRNLLYRLTVMSYNELGHTIYCKSTGVKMLSLGREEEAVIFAVERTATLPLYISCSFLVYTPKDDFSKRCSSSSSITTSTTTTISAQLHNTNSNSHLNNTHGTTSQPDQQHDQQNLANEDHDPGGSHDNLGHVDAANA